MKPLVFNRNSWHFKLAQELTNYYPRSIDDPDHHWGDNPDICTYTKHVLGALVLVLCGVTALVFLAYIVVEMLFGAVFAAVYGIELLSITATVGWLFTAICLVAWGGTEAITALSDWRTYRYCNPVKKPDGFVKQAYKSWKDKYCVPIDFVDPNEPVVEDTTADFLEKVVYPTPPDALPVEPVKEWVQEELFDDAPPVVGMPTLATAPLDINTPDEDNPIYQQLLNDRHDANWLTHADVHWGDLAHFLKVARNTRDPEAFNTALRVLEGIKQQLER